MNEQEKIRFITNLTTSICNELVDKVMSGRIPEEWDDHELRRLLVEKFDRERVRMARYRATAYNIVVYENDLMHYQ